MRLCNSTITDDSGDVKVHKFSSSAAGFKTAIVASHEGGMPNIGIRPGSMMGADHWQVLKEL
jgi:hypothetical protein